MKTPILLSWSGGKDAAFTLHELRRRGDFDVVALLTTVTSEYERIAMHGIRRELLHAQAHATGLPVIEATIPAQCDNATYEASFVRALDEARTRWPGLADIAFGDCSSRTSVRGGRPCARDSDGRRASRCSAATPGNSRAR